MSQENVEIVMGAFAAWNAGDMDTARQVWHPDATSDPRKAGPSLGSGAAAMPSFASSSIYAKRGTSTTLR